jgi:hypothetical protein
VDGEPHGGKGNGGRGSEKPSKTLWTKNIPQSRKKADHDSTNQKPHEESAHREAFISFLDQRERNFLF